MHVSGKPSVVGYSLQQSAEHGLLGCAQSGEQLGVVFVGQKLGLTGQVAGCGG